MWEPERLAAARKLLFILAFALDTPGNPSCHMIVGTAILSRMCDQLPSGLNKIGDASSVYSRMTSINSFGRLLLSVIEASFLGRSVLALGAAKLVIDVCGPISCASWVTTLMVVSDNVPCGGRRGEGANIDKQPCKLSKW